MMRRSNEASLFALRLLKCAFPCAAIALLFLSACSLPYAREGRGLRDENARPITPAHYRAHLMRMEGGSGPAYYLAEPAGKGRLGNTRPYAIIDVGYTNPLYSWTNRYPNWNDGADADRPLGLVDSVGCPTYWVGTHSDSTCTFQRGAATRAFVVQLSLPVAFHLLWDPLSTNAPIVNTDYEFGGEVALRVGLSENAELRTSLYAGHISTHIGDEYTLQARSRAEPFPRVNVSYEPFRFGVGWRRYGARADSMRANLPWDRWDVVFNLESSCVPGLCGSSPHYNVEASENDGYAVPCTDEGVEPTLTVMYSWLGRPITFTRAPHTRVPAEWFAGALVGRQNIFPYSPGDGPAPASRLPLRHALVLNAVWGRFFQRPVTSALPAAWYVRYFRGANPYGQLRNERNFSLLSLGLTFGR